ncbi:GNAT family N-acetyltransferase [Roseateles saccharophilus]|uniref:Ribosomal protein S18 acetylase RimI-like enzyme n=1 Tax=Roseateles saccharophilus TaxID=304 RepID=A0A4V2VQV7_ROSSA|nr:GNAT family N-acetyltransferase [Roseateles saccharophilus]MDG0835334.1 GNAT family N-acetyltransferase [Roseateles saccharophilus]TCU96139.1 ribosomal protein S18 acetylase RimI-like enzyme [Roseateles saccharophilus]
MDYRLRVATPADDAWQLAIYASTRADELAQTGWPPEQCERFVAMQHRAQQQHYLQHFPHAGCQLILAAADEIAGRLWVDRRPDGMHVLDIALLPAWRGRGIGTACLRALAGEADGRGQPLGIHVEIHNPARRLYERLGFVADGEPQGLHQAMHRPARRPTTEECLP